MNEKPFGEMCLYVLFGAVGLFRLRVALRVFWEGAMTFTNRSGRVIYTATGSEAVLCGVFVLALSAGLLCGAFFGIKSYLRER